MTSLKMMMLAAAGTIALAAPASAQVNGIAVANPEAAVARSSAWTAAQSQIQTQYKTQLDQANARRTAIENELRPLYTAFETARAAPNANEAALRTQAQTIQTRQQAGEQELQRLTAPASRAQAYALEQIQRQIGAAVQAAVARKNVQMLLRPDAALFAQPATDITADITTELNRLVPSVSIAVPANWQPGQQQAGAAGAPATTPARPATTTPARPNTGR
ncbi:periplasmic chaperone for outer membrane proteins Skp [Sphingomonas guangdongensis]|jgi:Skp family chaperone for outer membrane proteins|uniref:Periplasmic chaperone for outer membrane proteins Skp n=1 Tax=Sphingomonas guangdongensis TaxID=1141890 RepID=A0A285R151_9SPHN|nr:OmpH family outer membrane protein [Sphingomonas guangdongensis]SOB87843.1 periplasmic chaperone for outer membrane proteins Skp [Sphingomonas guangdongensis]